MWLDGDRLGLSASDLSGHLSCRHKTELDLAKKRGELQVSFHQDPFAEVLRERGAAHELRYVEQLRSRGLDIVSFAGEPGTPQQLPRIAEQTIAAMKRGAGVIVQGGLLRDRWMGRPDLLVRVEEPSALGAYGYEVHDTKLARETAGGTIVQLALYSDLLSDVLGRLPERFCVVTPAAENNVHAYRVADVAAHYRHLARGLLRAVDSPKRDTYPDPVDHCGVCGWWKYCDDRRRADDHPSYVAGLSRGHVRELARHRITTLEMIAALPDPIPLRLEHGSRDTYARLRAQARLQLEARATGAPVFELLPADPERGLALLPEPSPGDVFLDLEGDPFAREGGREYLFGAVGTGEAYRSWWAFDDRSEHRAFEDVLDFILDRWARDPGMHVYHFAPYEPSAMKRLMGRHAAREEDVDRLLRGKRFVDLHRVVKQTLRAGIETYSLKALEPFHGYVRVLPLEDARRSLRDLELALERLVPEVVSDETREAVRAYNEDDCRSTLSLRDWLERLRAGQVERGVSLPRPVHDDGAPSQPVAEARREAHERRERLHQGVPEDPAQRTPEEQARWILGHLLEWHWREQKVEAWEYFRMRELDEEEAFRERKAISGLTWAGTVKHKQTVIDTYTFPEQEADLDPDDVLEPAGAEASGRLGTVHTIDHLTGTITIKKSKAGIDHHPPVVFHHDWVRPAVLAQALLRFADDVLEQGFGPGAARDLLLRRQPRLLEGDLTPLPGERRSDVARRAGLCLDQTVLALQGPPGAGKTTTAAWMALDLLQAGKKIGVLAHSHKVIRNCLDAIVAEARARGRELRCLQRVREPSGDAPQEIVELTENAPVFAAVAAGEAEVIAGTAWLWAAPEMAGAVDVLFVDEAGQLSLANVIAAAGGGKNLVLLGDPQQLEQPQKASHPDGTDLSALQYFLGPGVKTIDERSGIFLDRTHRLPPSITRFTSELFYEGLLRSEPGLEQQALHGTGGLDGSGLWYVPVEHEGCTNASVAEAAVVEELVARLLGGRWTNRKGEVAPLQPEHILVVAPYNAQVARLAARLEPLGVQAGTVDKFQGREAPVVIFSMATSRPEDAPRGMEFLYSPNRLNVATSRARCACILVASPRLFEPECRTPRQIVLANAFCRYLELQNQGGGTGPTLYQPTSGVGKFAERDR